MPKQSDIEWALELARGLAAEHHRLCLSRQGAACDCYAGWKHEYVLSRALLAEHERAEELRKRMDGEAHAKDEAWKTYQRAFDAVERAEARVKRLEEVLRRVKENAESWHGPVPIQTKHGAHSGHAQALAVIAEWCDAALSERTEGK